MKRMKKFPLTLVALLTLVFSLSAVCQNGIATDEIKPPAWEAGKTYQLTLLHTNDHHGRILPVDLGGNAEPRYLGGLAYRAAYVKSVRAANANVLLIDAGDMNTGPALSNMFHAEPDFKAYNLIGYDAATFGNHEFDGDQAKLDKQLGWAEFPFVSSNIKTSNGKFLGGYQYLIKNYEGFRVGLLGITTLRTLEIASPDSSLTFIPEVTAAADAVDILRNREKAGIVIAITHIGDVQESPAHITSTILAAEVPGIDIIIDGHSHSFFATPQKIGDTWIITANEWGKYVGNGKLSIVNGALAGFEWEPVAIDNDIYTADPAVAALLQPYIDASEDSLSEVVGTAAADFDFGNRLTRYQETALGNMITDANVWYFNTYYPGQTIDFAFHNGGNIRANLTAGDLTRENILTVLPFENYLYIATLKGSEIIELFNFIGAIPQGNGGFAQFSKEVRYTIDKTQGDGVVTGLTIGGAAVDPNKIYRFCTNDYLLGGGDGYTILTQSNEPFNTSLLLSYVVIEYIASLGGTITPATDGRLIVIGGTLP